MHSKPSPQRNKIILRNKIKDFLKTNLFLIIITTLCVGFVVTYFSVQLAKSNNEPVIETRPHNTYSETIRVATDKNYQPYSYIDQNGQPTGYDVELIYTLSNTMQKNIELQMVEWNEAVDKITSGDVDIIMTCDIADAFDTPIQPLKSYVTLYYRIRPKI